MIENIKNNNLNESDTSKLLGIKLEKKSRPANMVSIAVPRVINTLALNLLEAILKTNPMTIMITAIDINTNKIIEMGIIHSLKQLLDLS